VTRPLDGATVLVTRPAERADHLVKRLEALGARTILAPTIRIAPVRSATLTRALRELAEGRFAWLVLTSPATVAMLADRVDNAAIHARVAAIGDGTGEAFRRFAGRDPDLRPRAFTTAALARAMPRGQGRVLCARADIAPEGLEEVLTAKGWDPTRVDAYRTTFPKRLSGQAARALAAGEVDAITFTSASTVRGFAGAAGEIRGRPKVVCIGPVTAREARGHGLRVAAVADPHTTEGLVDAVARALAGREGSSGPAR
jgi:uroporphyrinogen-III synthase